MKRSAREISDWKRVFWRSSTVRAIFVCALAFGVVLIVIVSIVDELVSQHRWHAELCSLFGRWVIKGIKELGKAALVIFVPYFAFGLATQKAKRRAIWETSIDTCKMCGYPLDSESRYGTRRCPECGHVSCHGGTRAVDESPINMESPTGKHQESRDALVDRK